MWFYVVFIKMQKAKCDWVYTVGLNFVFSITIKITFSLICNKEDEL